MIDLSGLDERFARLAAEYDVHRTAAHAAVVRWEWYDDEAFDLRPLHYQRDLSHPGHRLAERPDLAQDHFQIGFDADDRLVAMLEYSGFLGGKLYYETFRTYLVDTVEEAHFHADGRPIYLHEFGFEAGRMRSVAMVATGGGGCETYDYTDDQVTRIVTHHGDRQSGALLPLRFYTAIDAVYDDEGLVRLEISERLGSPQVKYERPPVGFTVEDAWATVQQELLTQIPRSVRDLAIDTPAYCIALMYDERADPTDFTIHVGLDEDRRVHLADKPDSDVIWSPADMAHETSVDLGAVSDVARLLAQELTLTCSDMGRGLLCAMASLLSAADWITVLPITKDFVVYAVDVEMEHLDDNLRRSDI
ncbi:hypothetical protein ABH926_007096 [Catenulispora sp. GP43]|uniref:hypothetical protein n=1 Tax=Catenulispora sp. GP43 TaxID=3156263 RepID=UPI0035188D8A